METHSVLREAYGARYDVISDAGNLNQKEILMGFIMQRTMVSILGVLLLNRRLPHVPLSSVAMFSLPR